MLLPERNVDWTVFAGNEWYSPNDVVPAFEAIRNNHSDCQNQFLSAIGNNHSGTLYEAATAAVPILIKIAPTHTRSSVAATSLDILEQIFYFDNLEDVPTVRIGEHAYTTAGAVKHFMISESEALLSVKAGAELHKMLEDAFAHYKSNDANAGKNAN